MSDSISRRNFLSRTIIGTLVALPIATYAVRRWRGKNPFHPGTFFDVTPLPIPDEVSGPFRTQACIAPDGKSILLAGYPPLPNGTAKVMFKGGTNEEVNSFKHSLTPSIYLASWIPQNKKDYRRLTKLPALGNIAAMAIHSNTSSIAFLSRESWGNRHYPDAIIPKADSKYPICDVLYTLPLSGGIPVPIQLFSTSYPYEGDALSVSVQSFMELALSPTFVCWHTNGESVYCQINKKIIQVFLDGKKKEIFDFKDNFLVSPLIHDNNGLSFVFSPFPRNSSVKTTPVLITIDDSGRVKSRKEFLPFTLGYNNCFFHAVFNHEKWAALTPTESVFGNKKQIESFKLDILDIETSSSSITQEILSNIKNSFVDLCHFFPDHSEILATKINYTGKIDNDTIAKFINNGGYGSTELLRIKVMQV
jgi:hypothetical protein